ncbi:MAG: AI-2E family transporter [Christensenellaceae bacterium]|jgi:predicted PurR-regulated permease PerM|nr:AI-2E family transporter [Christensenellaceae bacterium]
MATNFEINSNGSAPRYRNWAWGIVIVLILALVAGWGGWFNTVFFAFLAGSAAIIAGALIAFLLAKLVNFIENKLLKNAFLNSKYKAPFKRAISLTIVTVFVLGLLTLFMWLLIPRIVDVVTEVVGDPEGNVAKVRAQLITIFESLGAGGDIATDIVDTIIEWVRLSIVSIQDSIVDISTTILLGLGMALLSFFLAFLILKDKEKIVNFATRHIYANHSPERAGEIMLVKKRSEEILYGYFLSKFIEFVMLSVVAGIIFMILGVPYAWALAIILALFNVIPYVGIIIGLVPVVLVTFVFGTLSQALWAVILSVTSFSLICTFISPFITGNRMKSSMLLVLVSIVIGGAMFGMLGMFFAPPVAAVIVVIWQENIKVKEMRMGLRQIPALGGVPQEGVAGNIIPVGNVAVAEKKIQEPETKENIEEKTEPAKPKRRRKKADE